MNSTKHTTRIKMCGFTRPAHALSAVAAGADTLGFVFYKPSPRYIEPAAVRAIKALLPADTMLVGLFVNADATEVKNSVAASGVNVLQFHGHETPEFCEAMSRELGLPYWKVIHIAAGESSANPSEWVKYGQTYRSAQALLFDTASPLWGGTGQTFEWSQLLPLAQSANHDEAQHLSAPPLAHLLVLSGGLHAQNVGAGIALLRPWAVDVSSGIEPLGADGKPQKGIKDPQAMRDFVAAVKLADASLA